MTEKRASMKVRLLVVDDEKDITDMIVRYFRFKGFDIVGVNKPASALKMIEEENFQIVISDVVMPDMDGLELLRRIKAYNGGIQVIMITGYVTMHNILTAMRRGAETIFFKPLEEMGKLEQTVEACVNRIAMWQDILKQLGSKGKTELNHD